MIQCKSFVVSIQKLIIYLKTGWTLDFPSCNEWSVSLHLLKGSNWTNSKLIEMVICFRNAIWISFRYRNGSWVFWYINGYSTFISGRGFPITCLEKNDRIGYCLVLKLNPCIFQTSGIYFCSFVSMYVTHHCSKHMAKAKTLQDGWSKAYTY